MQQRRQPVIVLPKPNQRRHLNSTILSYGRKRAALMSCKVIPVIWLRTFFLHNSQGRYMKIHWNRQLCTLIFTMFVIIAPLSILCQKKKKSKEKRKKKQIRGGGEHSIFFSLRKNWIIAYCGTAVGACRKTSRILWSS